MHLLLVSVRENLTRGDYNYLLWTLYMSCPGISWKWCQLFSMLFQNLTQYIESLKTLLICSHFSLCLCSSTAVFCSFQRAEICAMKCPPTEKQAIKEKATMPLCIVAKHIYRSYLQQRRPYCTAINCSLCWKVQHIPPCLGDVTHSLHALMTKWMKLTY